MHEAALAQAAIPTPARVLGLQMRPYSIGHELWLIRQNNPLVAGGDILPGHIRAAALVCCDTWSGIIRSHRDPLLAVKVWLWRMRTRRAIWDLEEIEFREYRRDGSLFFPCESVRHSGNPTRIPGAPFLIRLVQFLIEHRLASAESVYDFPLGLAQMHYAAHLEKENVVEIYNEHDKKRDEMIAQMEAEASGKEANA